VSVETSEVIYFVETNSYIWSKQLDPVGKFVPSSNEIFWGLSSWGNSPYNDEIIKIG